MALQEKTSGGVLIAEETLRWMEAEIRRLAHKIDTAQGFAVNSKTSLAVRPTTGRPRHAVLGDANVIVKITEYGGAGKYLGQILLLSGDPIPEATNLTLAELGEFEPETVLIINLSEEGATEHQIAGGTHWGWLTNRESDQGRRVVFIDVESAVETACGEAGPTS